MHACGVDVLCEPAFVVGERSGDLFVGDETWLHGVWLPRSWILNTSCQSLRHEILQAGSFVSFLAAVTIPYDIFLFVRIYNHMILY